VRQNPAASELRQIITSLNVVPPATDTGEDRSLFGYLARNLSAQFLAYLVVDKKRDALESTGVTAPRIPDINEEERRMLEGAHAALVGLNAKCVEPLLNKIADYKRHLDPYSRFNYTLDPEVSPLPFFGEEEEAGVVATFRSHPALEIATSSFETLFAKRAGTSELYDQLFAAVVKWQEELFASGPLKAPPELEDLLGRESKSSGRRLAFKHTTALVGLRASLSMIDQLACQAVVADKLPVLSNNNTISVKSISHNLAGDGISLAYQPDDACGLPDPGSVILVHLDLQETIHEFCHLEQMNFSYSADSGTTVEVELRILDEHLNPFGAPLKHL
jgi:hypothetical protein